MSFIHYSSIENHTNAKYIKKFFEHHPECLNEDFIVQHKYDGANFQIIFTKNPKEIKFASRNLILDEYSKFNDYQNVIKEEKYQNLIKNIQNFIDENEDIENINLFGEIYGYRVCNRARYSSDKTRNSFKFFDVYFNGHKKAAKFFLEWSDKMGIPIVETFLIGKFDECVNFDVTNKTTSEGDLIEGVVVKPYTNQGDQPEQSSFYIKIKNEKFKEVEEKKLPKVKREKSDNNVNTSEVDEKLKLLKLGGNISEFDRYLTVNRLLNTYGKQEWTRKDIPKLAETLLLDAYADFKKDFPNSTCDIVELKKYFTSKVFKMISKEIKFENTIKIKNDNDDEFNLN
jgi:Rnl2 family RNA ligase